RLGTPIPNGLGAISALLKLGLGADLVSDAKPLQQPVDINSARATACRIDIGDRLCLQQSLPERLDGAYIGLGGTFFDHNTDTDAGKVDVAARRDFPSVREVIDNGGRDHPPNQKLPPPHPPPSTPPPLSFP